LAGLVVVLCAGCPGSDPVDRAPDSVASEALLLTPWTQFAGPSHDFKAPDPGLADSWPKGGPRKLWSRKLGPGHSGIVGDERRLFTMYRTGGREIVACLDPRTGETLWEHAYDAPLAEKHDSDYGDGPNSTPLLTDGRVYSIGVAGLMRSLDAETGRLLWSRDLWGRLAGTFLDFGYSSSPIAYKDTVIVLVGGDERGAVAFDKTDGHIVWQGLSFANSFSTPTIMNLLGEDQLVAAMATEVIGADPETGDLKWRYPIRNQYPQNICMPIRVDADLVFYSTTEAGSRGLGLANGGSFRVEERWSSRKVQCFYGAAVRVGDFVYGPSGWSAAPLLVALDARTGELAWRERGFAVANVIGAGDRLLILDADGKLALATADPSEIIHR
jgi:outer membrane protein assembly factor BamB